MDEEAFLGLDLLTAVAAHLAQARAGTAVLPRLPDPHVARARLVRAGSLLWTSSECRVPDSSCPSGFEEQVQHTQMPSWPEPDLTRKAFLRSELPTGWLPSLH